jgi:hypothetical protein
LFEASEETSIVHSITNIIYIKKDITKVAIKLEIISVNTGIFDVARNNGGNSKLIMAELTAIPIIMAALSSLFFLSIKSSNNETIRTEIIAAGAYPSIIDHHHFSFFRTAQHIFAM